MARRSNRLGKGLNPGRSWLGGLIALILLLLVLQTPVLKTVRNAIWGGLVSSLAQVLDIGLIRVEPDVQSQLETLQVENASLRAQIKDQSKLSEQLQRPSLDTKLSVAAWILPISSDVYGNELVLSRGGKDGITAGDPVVVRGKALVGVIASSTEDTSVVRLLTHPKVKVAAEVIEGERATGLTTSRSALAVGMDNIPGDANLAEGQMVATIAAGKIPAGLVVGKIIKVIRQENKPFTEAELELAYDVSEIFAVNVLVD